MVSPDSNLNQSLNAKEPTSAHEPAGVSREQPTHKTAAGSRGTDNKKQLPFRPVQSNLEADAETLTLNKKKVEVMGPKSEEAQRSYEISKQLFGTKTIHDLKEVFNKEHHRFDPSNLIAAIKHLGTLKGKRALEGKAEITLLTENLIRDLNAQMAQFSHEDLAKVIHMAGNIADAIQPKQIAVLTASLENALKNKAFSIKSLATLSHGLSLIDPDNSKLFNQLASILLRVPKQSATPNDLAALASTFCPLVPLNDKLVVQLAHLVINKAQEFSPDQLADLISAFDKARSRIPHKEALPLFDTLAKQATTRIEFFSPLQLADSARAMGNFQLDKEMMDPTLASEVPNAGTPNSFDMRGVFFGAVENAIQQHRGIIGARALCDIAFIFAKMGILDPKFMNHLANKMLEKQRGKPSVAETMRKEQLWRVLWAFATLGIVHRPLIDKMIFRTKQIAKELDNTSVGNILWSLAILDVRPDISTVQSLIDAFAASNPKEISIRQVFAFYQHATLPHPEGDYPIKWPPHLVEKFDVLKIGDVNISKLQSEVYAEVKKLHPEAVEEHPIRKMPVDIAIKKVVGDKKIKVAIEIDGPTHFAHKSREPLGHTQFKRRLLNRKGWQVVSVPYWDWNEPVTKNSETKAAYLKSVLPSEALQNQPKGNPPGASKSAMKKSRRPARAREAAAVQRKNPTPESDGEMYFSYDEQTERAKSPKERKKGLEKIPAESDDEGYFTAHDS